MCGIAAGERGEPGSDAEEDEVAGDLLAGLDSGDEQFDEDDDNAA